MRKEFDKSISRIRQAINTMEFIGKDCTKMQNLLACLKHPRSVEDRSYCTVLMLASHSCVIVSRYYEDISQMDVKCRMLDAKLYTPEIGSRLNALTSARAVVMRNVEYYEQLLTYRCDTVFNICNNIPFKNRYYR